MPEAEPSFSSVELVRAATAALRWIEAPTLREEPRS
jgi:hypothetical protein